MPIVSDAEWDRLHRALEEVTALSEIASAINIAMSVEEITRIAVDLSIRRLEASQGAVFLLSGDTPRMDKFKTFIRSMNPAVREIPFSLNMSLLGWMLKHKTVLVSNNLDDDARFRGIPFAKLGIRSLVGVPLLSLDGIIGALVVFNKNGTEGFTDTDADFLRIVGTQTAKIIENVKLFQKDLQWQRELKVAKEIQQGFLPAKALCESWCEICGMNVPAREVGGDFYDILRLSDQSVFASIGDVSGKGIPASLIMSNAQAVMRSHLLGDHQPDLGDLVGRLNRLICEFTSPSQYITAVYGCFDRETSTFRYVNAGHLPILVVRSNGSVESFTDSDPIVGVLPEIGYRTLDISLKCGDTLCLYTDGVTECWNAATEFFGMDRLVQALRETHSYQLHDMGISLASRLADFRSGAEQSDDITMLFLRPCASPE